MILFLVLMYMDVYCILLFFRCFIKNFLKNFLILNRFIIFCISFIVDFKEVYGDGVSGFWDFVEDSVVEINVYGGDREDVIFNGSRFWNVCFVFGLCKFWCVIIDV